MPRRAIRVLVIGRHGQIARALGEVAPRLGIEVQTRGRPDVDLTREKTLAAAIGEVRADVIINAGGYTAVDFAEQDQEMAFAVNTRGAQAAAEAAARAGLPLIHLSSDYIFDGRKPLPYRETDAPNPLNVYGKTKLAGERAIADCHLHHLILRTSWVFSAFGPNFLRTMLRLAGQRDCIDVVDDQIGNPSFADDIATAILEIVRIVCGGGARPKWGIFHMAGGDATTWCGFARAIVAASAARDGPFAEIVPITTAEYPTLAKRPLNSRLDCSKLAGAYNVRLPDWRSGMERCLDRIATNRWA